jgi:hypothetical protein
MYLKITAIILIKKHLILYYKQAIGGRESLDFFNKPPSNWPYSNLHRFLNVYIQTLYSTNGIKLPSSKTLALSIFIDTILPLQT